jgi:acyl-CoA thioesterase FadM
MKRQFRQTYTVRYDEGDCYGFLTPATFLRYLQDLAALDAEDAQLTGDGYWVARRTVLSFAIPVRVHSRLELETSLLGFTRITAQRAYEASMVGEHHDEPAISARTLWVYLDARGRPARLPAQTAQIWLPDGPLPPQPEAPWPAFPQSQPERAAYVVRFTDIDPMNHMNNASYVEALDNAAWEVYRKAGIMPEAATIQAIEYDIEYVESARFGELLEILSWIDPFPSTGQECSRLQQIKRGDAVLVRARSRWYCQQNG